MKYIKDNIEDMALTLAFLTVGFLLVNSSLIEINIWLINGIYLSNILGGACFILASLGFAASITKITEKLEGETKSHAKNFFLATVLIMFCAATWTLFDSFEGNYSIIKFLIILFSSFCFYGMYHSLIGIMYVISENQSGGTELLFKIIGLLIAIVSLVLTI